MTTDDEAGEPVYGPSPAERALATQQMQLEAERIYRRWATHVFRMREPEEPPK